MPAPLPVLTYRTVRLRWCRAALWALLKRWGVAIATGLLVLGTGATTGPTAIGGLLGCRWPPLFHAASQSPWRMAVETIAHSLIGGLLLLAVRPLLWSRGWAEAEAALPLDRSELRRADLAVVGLGLLPLICVYVAGTVSWLSASPHALPVVLLLVSVAMSMTWGRALLHVTRWPPSRRARTAGVAGTSVATGWRAGMWGSLIALPLARGPARRSARLAVASLAIQCALVVALAAWPALGGWWLAAFALAGLSLTARSRAVIDEDLGPLHAACMPLPLDLRRLRSARRAVALLPVMVSLIALSLFALARSPAFRPAVIASFVACAIAFNLIQLPMSNNEDSDPTVRVGAWLLMAVTLVALASEAMR